MKKYTRIDFRLTEELILKLSAEMGAEGANRESLSCTWLENLKSLYSCDVGGVLCLVFFNLKKN